ncbi:MAG: hypothetical protein RBS43_11275 [Candidatus Cloacimonas sp.]|jgi:preprotein translocase subunit SecB|nr:hypothetical protein [Candidatus Cloacimonas sp.]
MDIKQSELQQLAFTVLETGVLVIPPDDAVGGAVNELDIDFDLYINNEDDHLLRVFYTVKVKVAASKQSAGYQINVRVAGDFEIDRSLPCDSDGFTQLAKFSSVGITYNNLRAYLQTVTSFYPAPPYILPTIDLNDLWIKKGQEVQKQVSKKRHTIKK